MSDESRTIFLANTKQAKRRTFSIDNDFEFPQLSIKGNIENEGRRAALLEVSGG